jgi:hypothetical protein
MIIQLWSQYYSCLLYPLVDYITYIDGEKNVVDANLPTPMWQGYVSLLEGNGDIMRIYGLMVNQQFMEFSDNIF